jgi:hypothetical protein
VEGVPNSACAVDTGNVLNTSVVNFATGDSQSSKVTVTVPPGNEDIVKNAHVTVTAFATNGTQSSEIIPVE